jgi:hypothetical protein
MTLTTILAFATGVFLGAGSGFALATMFMKSSSRPPRAPDYPHGYYTPINDTKDPDQ